MTELMGRVENPSPFGRGTKGEGEGELELLGQLPLTRAAPSLRLLLELRAAHPLPVGEG